jgi:hypothetical protein
MSKRTIFVSCGQFTLQERQLGKAIVSLVDSIPGMKAYFAEEVQDLNGLGSNILAKLHECDGFITVMHPRGDIKKPDGSVFTRASVWIEQEIAIATYIRQIEKRSLPVIAFRHHSVGLEGIRGLIQLNPTEFVDEAEILAALPALLETWKTLTATGIRAGVTSTSTIRQQDGHEIRQLLFTVVNDSSSRIREISGEIRVPAGLLKHWPDNYAWEHHLTKDGRYQIFTKDGRYQICRFSEKNVGEIEPHSTGRIMILDYCRQCAITDTGEPVPQYAAIIVAQYSVEMTVWIEGREYHIAKTMRELSTEAGGG